MEYALIIHSDLASDMSVVCRTEPRNRTDPVIEGNPPWIYQTETPQYTFQDWT